ncbi:MAG TPA: hypothetical protein VMN57_12845, partial [Anaerolineales bacterium]|nr:hypothetical protein [Anaerolineales bacterium]
MVRTILLGLVLWVCAGVSGFAQVEEDPRYDEAYTILFLEPEGGPGGTPSEDADRGLALLQELAGEEHANALNTLG